MPLSQQKPCVSNASRLTVQRCTCPSPNSTLKPQVERSFLQVHYFISLESIGNTESTYLLTHLASSLHLHSRHYDPLVSTTTLLLDHLALRAEFLQDALCVAALVRVGVVVAHCRCCS